MNGKAATGIFFYDPAPVSLVEAVKSFEKDLRAFDPASIRMHALEFDRAVFKKKISEYILTRFREFKGGMKDA